MAHRQQCPGMCPLHVRVPALPLLGLFETGVQRAFSEEREKEHQIWGRQDSSSDLAVRLFSSFSELGLSPSQPHVDGA